MVLDIHLPLKINLSMMKERIRIGVDTGGTFTDFIISIRGKIEIKKIPSTPHNPALAILEGIEEFIGGSLSPGIIHGTTVATNSLLERKGGRIALITTKGFEDVLFIGRQVRRNLYSLKGEQRALLLPRNHCFGIKERTSSTGKVEIKISQLELAKILEKIQKVKAEAVAVCLINSYANSSNEQVILKGLKNTKIMTCLSSQILPEYREYERTTVTTINAYLMPVISRYLERLEAKLQNAELRIMQSNEGYISPITAKAEPIRTALSGPAGGVVGAFQVGKAAGFKNIITFDMGGTSSDVSLIDGQISRTSESMIGDFPIRLPIINIHSVGAGGGSIAYIDRGGSLRVGPQSAGADPGPACYGKGIFPTVTDANLVLGRLDPEFFLGGQMKIFPGRSRQALTKLTEKAGKPLLETAAGIIQIANANMEKAIRVISIERGIDPRIFSLFSFGGAGGMHAAEIASHLGISRIIVPKNAGVLSALGLLMADCIKDYSQSVLKKAENVNQEALDSQFAKLAKKGLMDMKKEGIRENDVKIFPFLDLRYLGQSYEITIPYRSDISYISDFHKAHHKLYSYQHLKQSVEIATIRVKTVGKSKKIKLKKLALTDTNPRKAFVKKQPLFYKSKEYQSSIFNRSLLEPGNIIKGPALCVDNESTTFLPPHYSMNVDGFLNLILHKKKIAK